MTFFKGGGIEKLRVWFILTFKKREKEREKKERVIGRF
jgi:hypothetical protein